MGQVIMQARALTKVFGTLVANDSVDLEIETGKIHAVAGENGAGKSTLMKMLYGVYAPTSGEVLMDGHPMHGWNAAAARENGVSMVFQDFRLIPAFTVLDNIYLSLAEGGFIIHRKQLRKRILEIAEKYHLHVVPDEEVWKTDLGQRQHIEIIKILINSGTRVMIFDEPTSVLAPHEVSSFLDMLKSFRDNGYAILLITHKINEIIAVADKVTVMRQGRVVCRLLREEGFMREAIVAAMLGEDVHITEATLGKHGGEDYSELPAVRLCDVAVLDDHQREIVSNVSFDIQPGEILGVAGISGNGQRELAEAIFGIRRIENGKMFWGDAELTHASVQKRLDVGFRMVTENPLSDNVVGDFSVLENMALAGIPIAMHRGDIDWRKMRNEYLAMEETKLLKVPEPERRAGSLSGGNVQRLALARAIIAAPRLLIACYPSRGLDVATVNIVHKTLLGLCARGSAVLLISEDLTELLELSDRLIVLCTHTTCGPYDPKGTDATRIGKIMLGEDSGDETVA